MGQRPFVLWSMLLVLLAACGGQPAPVSDGPRLIGDVTLTPTVPPPLRAVEPGISPTVTATTTNLPVAQAATEVPGLPTGEVRSPLDIATVDAQFVLVTPTLPPSKTPTQTPTITLTPTQTPTPSLTATATATRPQFPTSVVVPVTAPVPQPLPQVCDSTWFFAEPRPPACPLNPPLTGQGVFQAFQNGYMIWVGAQDAIYVFYADAASPRWEVYRDGFEEGMPEFDAEYIESPFPNTWQPRRGFGLLWRSNSTVRERIGWATQEWEQGYSVQVQIAADGTVFMSAADGSIFSAVPGNLIWTRYGGVAPG